MDEIFFSFRFLPHLPYIHTWSSRADELFTYHSSIGRFSFERFLDKQREIGLFPFPIFRDLAKFAKIGKRKWKLSKQNLQNQYVSHWKGNIQRHFVIWIFQKRSCWKKFIKSKPPEFSLSWRMNPTLDPSFTNLV